MRKLAPTECGRKRGVVDNAPYNDGEGRKCEGRLGEYQNLQATCKFYLDVFNRYLL